MPSEPRPLYEVLQEVKTTIKSNEIYSSDHTYKIGNQPAEAAEA